MKRRTLFTLLQYVAFLGLGFLLIWWQYTQLTQADLAEINVAFSQVRERLWLIFPVLIIGFMSHLFRALRWKLLLEPLNLRPSTVNITCAVMVGYLTNLLLPRMGEVVRCTVLAQYEKEPADKIIGTIVVERSFDLVCLVLVALLTFLLQISAVSAYTADLMHRFSDQGRTVLIVVLILVFLILISVFIYRRNRQSKVGSFLGGIGKGISSIRYMNRKWLFLFYSFLIWGCYLLLIWVGFRSMAATEHLGIKAALGVLVFGSLGMIVTPGGLGAYPLAVKEVLRKLYFIAPAYALAFGWVSWLAQTVIIILFGLLALLILPVYNRKNLDGKNNLGSA